MPSLHPTDDHIARQADLAFDVGERVHLDPRTIAELIRRIEGLGARATVSSVHAHVVVGDWDKARGVERAVREVLGRDLTTEAHRFVFVGDSGNDAAAFAFFPLTVGVANVRAHLDALSVPPRWVTHGDRGRGFAELAERLLAVRGAGGGEVPEPEAR